jgi:hypothetical protein
MSIDGVLLIFIQQRKLLPNLFLGPSQFFLNRFPTFLITLFFVYLILVSF